MEWIPLLAAFVVGFITAWFMAKFKYSSPGLSEAEIKSKYVLRELFDNLQIQADLYREDLSEKEQEIRQWSRLAAVAEQSRLHLEEQLKTQKGELAMLQEKFKIEFSNIANRLLEEKSQKFTLQNQRQLQDVLQPLREKIQEFESGMRHRFYEEAKDRVSLKKEIEQLRDLNAQLSEDANKLVSALKGENKTQGDWGEYQLQMLLERAGLQKGVHFQTQISFKDDGGRQKRPDFIINLPNDKHLIIDCKVSLVAYERYFSADKDKKRDKLLKAHLNSIRKHIHDLSNKNYQQLYQINSPDYLLLFVPIEPAFSLAIQSDPQLFNLALDRNVVLVTSSTLLATMRTVSYIWKQEKQKRSVLEIARQSGLLYDKFVNFVDDLKSIGVRLKHAQSAYSDAMNKLVDSKKQGDTLIGRAEKIKKLGAKTSKSLPKDLVETAAEKQEILRPGHGEPQE